MSQPRTTLARLSEELRTIEVFDRIREFAPHADPANERLYEVRHIRRRQIEEEIARLRTCNKPELWKPARLSWAFAIIYAFGYAMVYYTLK
jgi:hypothetical protein